MLHEKLKILRRGIGLRQDAKKHRQHDRDAIDIGSYFGDSSKAKRMLGWEPRTPFVDGIAQTVEFYRSHRSRYL